MDWMGGNVECVGELRNLERTHLLSNLILDEELYYSEFLRV
jgi:hypothetical protein